MVKFKLIEKLLKTTSSSGSTSSSSKSKSSIEPSSSTTDIDTKTVDATSNDPNSLFKILSDEFSCSCCLELLKRPVTLACGHSFCQLCLANWYLASSNTTCPACRQEWKSMPKLNFKLKSSIEKLARFELSRPSNQNNTYLLEYLQSFNKLNKEEKKVLKKFEEKYKSRNSGFYLFRNFSDFNLNYEIDGVNAREDSEFLDVNDDELSGNMMMPGMDDAMYIENINEHHQHNQPTHASITYYIDRMGQVLRGLNNSPYIPIILFGFSFGLLITLSFFGFLIYLTTSFGGKMQFSSNIGQFRNKYTKPAEKWSVGETQEWFYQLGPWTSEIANAAQLINLDGAKLLQLKEQDLAQSPFNIRNEQIRHLLIDSVQILKNFSIQSVDFWDFKNSNRLKVVFFSFFVEAFPRTTLIYQYVSNNQIFFKWINKLSRNIRDMNNNDFIYMDNLRRILLSESLDVNARLANVDGNSDTSKNSLKMSHLLPFPYMRLKNVINVLFYETNKITCWFITLNCLVLTLADLVVFIDIVASLITSDKIRLNYLLTEQALKSVTKFILYYSFYVIYNVIPNFLIDLIFFYFLFFKIIFNMYELLGYAKSFIEHRRLGQISENLTNHSD